MVPPQLAFLHTKISFLAREVDKMKGTGEVKGMSLHYWAFFSTINKASWVPQSSN